MLSGVELGGVEVGRGWCGGGGGCAYFLESKGRGTEGFRLVTLGGLGSGVADVGRSQAWQVGWGAREGSCSSGDGCVPGGGGSRPGAVVPLLDARGGTSPTASWRGSSSAGSSSSSSSSSKDALASGPAAEGGNSVSAHLSSSGVPFLSGQGEGPVFSNPRCGGGSRSAAPRVAQRGGARARPLPPLTPIHHPALCHLHGALPPAPTIFATPAVSACCPAPAVTCYITRNVPPPPPRPLRWAPCRSTAPVWRRTPRTWPATSRAT